MKPRDSTGVQVKEPRRNQQRRWRRAAREVEGKPGEGESEGREGFKEEEDSEPWQIRDLRRRFSFWTRDQS